MYFPSGEKVIHGSFLPGSEILPGAKITAESPGGVWPRYKLSTGIGCAKHVFKSSRQRIEKIYVLILFISLFDIVIVLISVGMCLLYSADFH
jgi:hypothetical protein